MFDTFGTRSLATTIYDNEEFPALLVEPWRVESLLVQEVKKQRERLFRFVWFARLVFLMLGILLSVLDDTIYLRTLLMVSFGYVTLFVALYWHAVWYKQNVVTHSYLLGLFEVFFISYFFIISDDQLELSFIFFSVLLSAVLLPLSKLLVIIFLAYIMVTLWWLDSTTLFLESMVPNFSHTDWGMLADYLVSRKNKEILVIMSASLLIAFVINRLASWAFMNEVRASFRYKQMRQMLAYNRAIIEHLKTGVITLNPSGKIISINHRAIDLLNLKTDKPVTELTDLSEKLFGYFKSWLSEGVELADSYRHNANAEEVMVSFSRFKSSQPLIMMSLDSVNVSIQQSREAKLSSLGRLTAGIAHEIRNPLTAINSAAQLLNEEVTDARHLQLSKLVVNNIQRADKVIKNVLSLFNDVQPTRERIEMNAVLSEFAREFLEAHKDYAFTLQVATTYEKSLYIMFDVGQFNQVLWNLCFNAIKYAEVPELSITLVYQLSSDERMVCIDVLDNGKGVTEAQQSYLFEPFYSNSSGGSGLGLYLVRELCSANNANIAYVPAKERNDLLNEYGQGACFQISAQAYFSNNTQLKLRDSW